ncbi:DEAD/DEAH box helicase family protein [Curtobacterium sp. MCSS17_016]|uniref:DEAD/DEAH box helicase family protein n=1 Tax=Curtobacterium sp. MCSS17_016 TaxID=2175644 RepID=UPI000DAA8117|nr:DEAD/DEAH box helicase family protein [Curtobacterium sp. MCSS17_016]WIE80866.1 DEAD/DEAH box helicase family protein [Curtobacterium sp. MCSS17_016]
MTSSTFDALERAIPRDPRDNSQYGSHFELVSDYALRQSAEYGPHIKTIETYGQWAVRNGRSRQDVGVDRVITTVSGDLWTVQNKGYAADRRVDLTDFTNFVVASDTLPNVQRRLLVTSGSGLGRNAAEVAKRQQAGQNVTVLNRSWLRGATAYPDTWEDLLAVVGEPGHRAKPFTLRPHQVDAVEDVVASLRAVPECQLLSACGTGKTITSVGIADELEAKTVVYFVPSLALMAQTIQHVRRQHAGRLITTLAVCSDDTVGGRRRRGDDDTAVDTDDLGTQVLRNAADIAAFVANGSDTSERLIVFCTYQSAHLLVTAQHHHGLAEFDYAFNDEAHHLVATKATNDSLGEEVKRKNDGRERLRARWRVYATATARQVSARATVLARKYGVELDSLGEANTTFGPVAHEFTFGDAIEEGILSDYRVSILGVTDEDYQAHIEERTFMESAGGRIDGGTFAAVQALRHALALGATRVISYHNSLAAAEEYARLVDADVDLPAASMVSGQMNADTREQHLARMASTDGYVISNVRCLNEGIDIPALDAIIIAEPKASPVEIAQSIGRAIRRAEGKTVGHIIVPVAVTLNEDGALTAGQIGDLTGPSNPWRAVFEVLDALGQHDRSIRHFLTVAALGLERRAKREGIPTDEFPDAGDLEGLVDDVESSAITATGAVAALGGHRIIGDKVVVSIPSLSADVVAKIANSLRLATVRTSQREQSASDRELIIRWLVEGGWTVADAEAAFADKSRSDIVKRAAA